ncbi:copper resistance protein CopB (plasmid) [Ralstonia solanacearum]|nr:copper resistance protein CopB [Ralstonia solanacearum]
MQTRRLLLLAIAMPVLLGWVAAQAARRGEPAFCGRRLALRIRRPRFVNSTTKLRLMAHSERLGRATSNIPGASGHP